MNERLLMAVLISDCMLFLITERNQRLWEPEATEGTHQMCRRPLQNGFIVALQRIQSGTRIKKQLFNRKYCNEIEAKISVQQINKDTREETGNCSY